MKDIGAKLHTDQVVALSTFSEDDINLAYKWFNLQLFPKRENIAKKDKHSQSHINAHILRIATLLTAFNNQLDKNRVRTLVTGPEVADDKK